MPRPFNPPVYSLPFGFPVPWQCERAYLEPAVLAYQGHGEVTDRLAQYLAYYVAAPCWLSDPNLTAVDTMLITQAAKALRHATTAAQITPLLNAVARFGVFPFGLQDAPEQGAIAYAAL